MPVACNTSRFSHFTAQLYKFTRFILIMPHFLHHLIYVEMTAFRKSNCFVLNLLSNGNMRRLRIAIPNEVTHFKQEFWCDVEDQISCCTNTTPPTRFLPIISIVLVLFFSVGGIPAFAPISYLRIDEYNNMHAERL